MLDSAKAGLIYVCNPNNPTASITPKDELRDFIAKTPPQTMILVDEAYFHYADSPDYESVIALVKDHPNLIVVTHILENLWHGRIALWLLCRPERNDRSAAPKSNVGQRQLHGSGRSNRES